MQAEIFGKYPDAELQVTAVWLPMWPGDGRSEWNPDLLSDARVTHFWDEERQAGLWFAQNVSSQTPIAWDIYFLYGAEATWADIPTPIVSYGRTIIAKKEQLRTDLMVLLELETTQQ